MAKIIEVLGSEKINETVQCTKRLLAKLEDNPKWADTFEKEVAEFKKTHSDAEKNFPVKVIPFHF